MNVENMKSLDNHDRDMRPEYDFSGAQRGRHVKAYAAGTNVVLLDPDVAARFSDSAQVNSALRQVLSKSGARDKEKRVLAKQPGLDGRHRDEDGEIHRKRSDTLVKTLRKEYGEDFLSGFQSDTTLGTVLKKTGADSLSDLLKTKKRR